MTPELLNLIYVVGGLALGWVARHWGIGGPKSPLVPALPMPAPSTGHPLLDSLLPALVKLIQDEMQKHMAELAVRIIPPADPTPAQPPRSS